MESTTKRGETALHLASSQGGPSTIRLLCEKGADVNSTTADGSTSLSLAARFGNIDCVRVLMENMADVKIEDAEGSRALEEPLRKQLDVFNWISTVIQFLYLPFSFTNISLVSATYGIILHILELFWIPT